MTENYQEKFFYQDFPRQVLSQIKRLFKKLAWDMSITIDHAIKKWLFCLFSSNTKSNVLKIFESFKIKARRLCFSKNRLTDN